MADTHLIEVRAGRGEPPTLELRPGIELAPLSVGTGGAWQVTAAGVLFVHLYIYFDGQTLFVQAADSADPPMIDGRPVPAEWTAAPPRCTIAFGQARLTLRPADAVADAGEGDPTYAEALPDEGHPGLHHPTPAPAAMPARPFKPGAFASPVDGESTRLQPLEDFAGPPASGDSTRVEPLGGAVEAVRAAAIRPAAGAAPWVPGGPGGGGAPQQASGGAYPPTRPFPMAPPNFGTEQTAAGQPGQGGGGPAGLLNIAPPSVRKPDAPETFEQRVKREWTSAPPLRRGLFAVMPVAVLVALWLVFAGGAPPPPAKHAGPETSAVATTPAPPVTAPLPVPTDVATAWPPTEPVPIPTVPPPRPVTPPVSSATAAAAGDAGAAANSDHRERQAADFVATHAYDQAIRLYDQLAAERPQNPAFHEAARILRAKLAAGNQ